MRNLYIVQRCWYAKKGRQRWTYNLKVSEYFEMDYMGSSEFEYGATAKSIRAIHSQLDKMEILKSSIQGKKFWVFCLPEDREELQKQLDLYCQGKAINGVRDLKEWIRFPQVLGVQKWYTYNNPEYAENFWWDLEANVAWCLKKEELENFKEAIVNSVKFMDEQKQKEMAVK